LEKRNCERSDAKVAARHGLGSGSPAYVVQGSEFEDDRDNKGEQITIGISNVETWVVWSLSVAAVAMPMSRTSLDRWVDDKRGHVQGKSVYCSDRWSMVDEERAGG